MNNIEKFKFLSKCNTIGISKFVDVKQFTNNYKCLKLGNGGSWCRFDGKFGREFKIIFVKENGNIRYSWKPSNIEEVIIKKNTLFYMRKNNIIIKKRNSIKLIKMCGKQIDNKFNRNIGKKIKKHFNNKSCVSCGSNSNLEIDHKNGLYNDPDVLNIKTQKINHFQILCKHCNDQKRQSINYTKKTNKRYPSTNIPMLKIFNIPFTVGNENYDPNDKNWSIGTYWHDPIQFMKDIKQLI